MSHWSNNYRGKGINWITWTQYPVYSIAVFLKSLGIYYRKEQMSKYIIFVGKLVFFAKRELKMHNGGKSRMWPGEKLWCWNWIGGNSMLNITFKIYFLSSICWETLIGNLFFFFNKETLNEFFRLQGQYTISVAHSSFQKIFLCMFACVCYILFCFCNPLRMLKSFLAHRLHKNRP